MTKIMIASDIHGSATYCRKMLKAFEQEKASKLVLLGDILYHGPRNDLPEEYAPKEVISMLNPIKNQILAVRGNCDSEVDQMVLEFPIMADYALLWAGTHLIFITHGHQYNTTCLPPMSPGDILLHGHTHIPSAESFGNNNLYLNPGSVSIPKNGSSRGYMIFTENTFCWKDLDGNEYKSLKIN